MLEMGPRLSCIYYTALKHDSFGPLFRHMTFTKIMVKILNENFAICIFKYRSIFLNALHFLLEKKFKN